MRKRDSAKRWVVGEAVVRPKGVVEAVEHPHSRRNGRQERFEIGDGWSLTLTARNRFHNGS